MPENVKLKVTISTKEKTTTRTFVTEKEIKLSDEDSFIKSCVSEVLKDFTEAPEKIKVVATLAL